jgi:hypothetical protein
MYQYHPYSLTRTFFNHTGPIGGHTTKGGIVAPLYLAENTTGQVRQSRSRRGRFLAVVMVAAGEDTR